MIISSKLETKLYKCKPKTAHQNTINNLIQANEAQIWAAVIRKRKKINLWIRELNRIFNRWSSKKYLYSIDESELVRERECASEMSDLRVILYLWTEASTDIIRSLSLCWAYDLSYGRFRWDRPIKIVMFQLIRTLLFYYVKKKSTFFKLVKLRIQSTLVNHDNNNF